MNRNNHVSLKKTAFATAVAKVQSVQKCRRNKQQRQRPPSPESYLENILYVPMKAPLSRKVPSTSNKQPSSNPNKSPAQKNAAGMWKSTFKPADENSSPSRDVTSQDKSASSSEKGDLYDPYDPVSSQSQSESESESEAVSPPGPDDVDYRPLRSHDLAHRGYEPFSPDLEHQNDRDHRWAEPYSQLGSARRDGRDPGPDAGRPERQGASPRDERRSYSPEGGHPERPGYGSVSRLLDPRGLSPESSARHVPMSALPVLFPSTSYGQTNGEERTTVPEHRRERPTTVRLSPPRLQPDYVYQSGYVQKGTDQIPPSEVARHRSRSPIREAEKSPFTCELCEVELASMEDLEEHLESQSHWDTLEHIQQQNSYDDLAIAFLQEVLLFKVKQCSQAMVKSAIKALQEEEHMTKVEMVHCAACKVNISTSVSAVQNHLSSQEHLCNKKEFGLRQRRTCLDKAKTMMQELKPQFEQFFKGDDPFV